MGLRRPAPPAKTAPQFRSPQLLVVCLALGAVFGCAGAGKGGSAGSVGTSSSGRGGATDAAGTTGAAGTASAAGTTGVAGAAGAAGTTGTGGVTGAAGNGVGGVTGAAGTTGAGGTTGAAGTTGAGGVTGGGGTTNMDAGTDAVCQTAEVNFAPKIPTVFILVDRSGSEFTNETTGTFFNLRTAVLQVLQQLTTNNTQMRLGFGAFVGNHGGSTCMQVFDSTPIDDIAKNYDAIATKYNALGPLSPYGTKAETPMSAIMPTVEALLAADTGNGQKYLLVATDGQTDFCDDGNNLCPADAIIYRAQEMYAAGIGTLVLGLPSEMGGGTAFNMAVLQGLANAGAGQNVALTGLGASASLDVYNQCNGVAGWTAIRTAANLPASGSLTSYASPPGAAKLFTPSSTSTTDLANQIAAAINAVKSCSFDLSDVGGKSIKVDPTKLAEASIAIMGSTIPQDATNGWSMDAGNTAVILNGNACTTWRLPGSSKIDFNFPCSSIIFE